VAAGEWRGNVKAMRIGRARMIAERHAAGLKAPGDRRKGRWWQKPKDGVEMAVRLIEDQLAQLPAVEKPAEQMTMPSFCGRGRGSAFCARMRFYRRHAI
jgi:hypothetical protein